MNLAKTNGKTGIGFVVSVIGMVLVTNFLGNALNLSFLQFLYLSVIMGLTLGGVMGFAVAYTNERVSSLERRNQKGSKPSTKSEV